MELEIQNNLGTDPIQSGIVCKVDNFEGIISHSIKLPVFWIEGYNCKAVLRFETEEEIEDLIEALQYFKEHKTYPPTE